MTDLTPVELAKEEAVVSRLLPFDINGQTRTVTELVWRANREWKALMQATFARLVSTGPNTDTPDGQQTMLDAERDLVLAYDAAHTLGDLEDATEREIDTIYNGLVTVAFPLAASPMAVGLMFLRAAVASAQASSTNGPSPTGISAVPTILKDRLPSGRSTSSTRRRKSVSRKSSAIA
jgi:hypothetical protein